MNELYHYSVKGMRWGVRRYQNKNGSLTSAGKKRYKTNDESDRDLMSRPIEKLHSEISRKSGIGYFGKGVSDGFKKTLSEYDNRTKEIDQKYKSRFKDAYDKASKERDEYYNKKRNKLSAKLSESTDPSKKRKIERKINRDPKYMISKAKANHLDDLVTTHKLKVREKEQSERNAAEKYYEDKLSGVVLKDLGYRDTQRGREYLRDHGLV